MKETSVCKYLHEIETYKTGRPIEEVQREFGLKRVVKLASNENFLPPSAQVRQAIVKEIENCPLYPDNDSFYLRNKLALKYNLDIENIIVGAGSVELIRIIIKTFLNPGEEVLTSAYGFSFYKVATVEHAGLKAFREVAMTEDYCFDLQRLAEEIRPETKIIFLTNPNNPTGTFVPPAELAEFVKNVDPAKIVVLDNAYEEYVERSLGYFTGLDLIRERDNIIVLKTFSKIYGLAALRIGFALASRETIAYLNKLKAPFNVSRIAQAAAEAALDAGDYLECSYSENLKNRTLLLEGLEEMKIRAFPSQTNFIMFFPPVDAEALNKKLLQRGVIIRPLRSFGLPEALRVSVGSRTDCKYFLKSLKEALKEF